MSRRRAMFFVQNAVLQNPNTFIGGAGSVIVDEADIASITSLLVDDIQNFINDGTDVSFYVETPYTINNTPNIFGTTVSWFFDPDGYCTDMGYRTFYNNSISTNKILADNVVSWPTQICRNGTPIQYIRFPNLITLSKVYLNYAKAGNTRLYLPKGIFTGDPATNIGGFNTSAKTTMILYLDPVNATSNSGSPDAELTGITHVVYVTNFTPPSNVTDLAYSNVTTTSVDLSFTPPSSTNALDFYEVWIDDGTNNPLYLYHFFAEISGSGDTLSGLISGTTYKIKIVACDEFWNRSAISNIIEVTTL